MITDKSRTKVAQLFAAVTATATPPSPTPCLFVPLIRFWLGFASFLCAAALTSAPHASPFLLLRLTEWLCWAFDWHPPHFGIESRLASCHFPVPCFHFPLLPSSFSLLPLPFLPLPFSLPLLPFLQWLLRKDATKLFSRLADGSSSKSLCTRYFGRL